MAVGHTVGHLYIRGLIHQSARSSVGLSTSWIVHQLDCPSVGLSISWIVHQLVHPSVYSEFIEIKKSKTI